MNSPEKTEAQDVLNLGFFQKKAQALLDVVKHLDKLGRLPFAFIQNIFDKETPQEQQETIELIARHESGHALMDILNNEPITKMYIEKTSLRVQNCLGMFAGAVEKGKIEKFNTLGLVRSLKNLLGMEPDIETEVPKNTDKLVRTVLEYMGGPATEYAFGKKNGDFFDKLKRADTNNPMQDHEQVVYLLKETMQAKKRNINREHLDQISEAIFKKTVEFYSDPSVKQAIGIMGDYLREEAEIKEQKGGAGINQKIVKRLAEKGVSESEFKKISEKYESLVQELTGFLNNAFGEATPSTPPQPQQP